ncbi:MAG: exodeoxyribonuclease III [Pseudomonadales bacterium]
MRIATWNVNGLRARLDFVRLWLQDRQPDVVGLQELKVEDAGFPHDLFNELGYTVATHAQKSWNGVAIASRLPLEVEARGLPGQQDMGARLITARVEQLSFTTVYCPNGKDVDHEDFPRKLGWFEDLAAYWSDHRASSEQLVLCGDFNVVPTALDSWLDDSGDGQIFHTVQERSRFEALMSLGLHDLYRVAHTAERAFSWWDYRGGAFHRGHGLRIDFVLGSAAVRARVTSAVIDRDYRKKKDGLTASDHAPVIIELD